MPVETADAGAFFERARLEAERYGEDGWVFLRELVQNARDARATRIEFETVAAGGDEQLTCRDNGAGMSPDDVDRFLLRLYASSKEDDRDSIGFFGVGFWSVLLFEPREIRVVTRNGGTVRASTAASSCPTAWAAASAPAASTACWASARRRRCGSTRAASWCARRRGSTR